MDFTMSAKRNFNSNDILSVLKTGNFSTGEIARKIRCDRVHYFTNWIEKSFSFIPISKYFPVKCLKSYGDR